MIFDKKTFGSGIKNENISNKELVEEFHKQMWIHIQSDKNAAYTPNNRTNFLLLTN